MELKQVVSQLEENQSFLDWKKDHKDCFLSYAFALIEKDAPDAWQVGFYDKKEDKITNFAVAGTQVEIGENQEIFKKPEAKVLPVDIDKVSISLAHLMDILDEFQNKEYKQETPQKMIIILQKIKDFGLVWNVTYITLTMKTLNMKIDAGSGKVVFHKLTSLFDYKMG